MHRIKQQYKIRFTLGTLQIPKLISKTNGYCSKFPPGRVFRSTYTSKRYQVQRRIAMSKWLVICQLIKLKSYWSVNTAQNTSKRLRFSYMTKLLIKQSTNGHMTTYLKNDSYLKIISKQTETCLHRLQLGLQKKVSRLLATQAVSKPISIPCQIAQIIS